MSLPLTGLISVRDVNIELGRSANASINLNETAIRELFQKPSGKISLSDGYGKSKLSYTGRARAYFSKGDIIGGVYNSDPATLIAPDGITSFAVWGGFSGVGLWAVYQGTKPLFKAFVIDGITYPFTSYQTYPPNFYQTTSSGPNLVNNTWHDLEWY